MFACGRSKSRPASLKECDPSIRGVGMASWRRPAAGRSLSGLCRGRKYSTVEFESMEDGYAAMTIVDELSSVCRPLGLSVSRSRSVRCLVFCHCFFVFMFSFSIFHVFSVAIARPLSRVAVLELASPPRRSSDGQKKMASRGEARGMQGKAKQSQSKAPRLVWMAWSVNCLVERAPESVWAPA